MNKDNLFIHSDPFMGGVRDMSAHHMVEGKGQDWESVPVGGTVAFPAVSDCSRLRM